MTDKKFRKIVKEHPYLANPAFIMTRSEAEEIYNQGFPTAEEIIEGAKEKSGLPYDAWKEFDEALFRKKYNSTHFMRRVKYRETLNSIRTHKRVAILLVAFLLLTSFFTLVPAGRALARDFYEYVIQLFDNKLEIGHRYETEDTSGDYDLLQEEETKSIQYQSFDEFYAENGLEPFVIDWLAVERIIYDESIYSLKKLTASYSNDESNFLKVRQEWEISTGLEKYYSALDNYHQIQVRDGMIMYYSIDQIDGEIFGVFALPDSIITISTYDEKLFDQLIERMRTF